MRGPLDISRTATTRVVHADRPREMQGTAALGPRTQARARWELTSAGTRTRVRLTAVVDEGSPGDRALLALAAASG